MTSVIPVYVIGIVSGKEDKTKNITKEDITKNLDSEQVNYEYKEIDLSKVKELSDTLMEVLVYCSKHSITGNYNQGDKDGDQANSCEIF